MESVRPLHTIGIGRTTVPVHLAIGLVLVAVTWWTAWFGPRPVSDYMFAPLWLGYILTVDGLAVWRSGSSLMVRNARQFALLFLYSMPLWWLFEFANRYLDNWHYSLPRPYSRPVYLSLASVAFSTVMPAVFVTAELVRIVLPLRQRRRWIVFAPGRMARVAIAVLGLGMFMASLAFPDVAFPLVWVGVFLFLDAINSLAGGRSIAGQVARGQWDTVVVLFVAGLVCGVFWELWNSGSMPKWTYDVPHVPDLRLFEMPIPGYGGYLPFALEIYAFYQIIQTVLRRREDGFLHFDRAS